MKNKQQPTIYTNERQLTLCTVSLLTISLSIFTAYMIFSDLDSFLMEFSSKISGIIWMILMMILGNIMLICMIWLSGRYVLKIENAEEGFINIQTWSILGFYKKRKYPKDILNQQKYHEGYTKFNGVPAANAPWIQIKTQEGKTLIIDAQGEFNL